MLHTSWIFLEFFVTTFDVKTFYENILQTISINVKQLSRKIH